MISNRDRASVLDQISNLKICSDKIRENLSAIQLLMVDSNYSRTKDSSISGELQSLIKQADTMSNSIDIMEKRLLM